MKPKVSVCPLRLLEPLPGDGSAVAVISSSSPPAPRLLPCAPYVLRVYQDVDREIPGRSFSREDARAMADFIRGIDPGVKQIWCCCDMGESRSPAVAAAVSRYLEQDDTPIWTNPRFHPNMLVFDYLTQALGVGVTDEEKDELLYRNRKAFRDAIRRARK